MEDHINFTTTWCPREVYHSLEHLFRTVVVESIHDESIHDKKHPGKVCRGFVVPIICFTWPAVYHASKDHGPDRNSMSDFS